jgi:molybdate transport system substrate-binding protein
MAASERAKDRSQRSAQVSNVKEGTEVKRRSWVLLAIAAMVMMVLGAGAGPASAATQPKFTVFAAASLYKAFPAMVAPFKARYPQYKKVKFVFNFAGTQQLYQQLIAKAPADLFASANTTYIDDLQPPVVPTSYLYTPRIFCQNALCVIVPNVKNRKVKSLADLTKPGIQVAVGTWGTNGVPIGTYTQKVLTNLNADPALSSTYATDVDNNVLTVGDIAANVNMITALVSWNEVDAGFVYNSDKVAAGTKVIRIPIADAYQSSPLPTYPMAVVQGSAHVTLGKRFIAYVMGLKGQAIMKRWGFRAEPVPAIKQLAGTSGASGAAGSTVTITGVNFKTYIPGAVKFGATQATTTAWGASSITATVPTLAAGNYNVTVTADGRVSKVATFTVTP